MERNDALNPGPADNESYVIGPPDSPGPTSNDTFDPARLRLSQDFGNKAGVKKALVTVPVGKPNRQTFFRIHPDEKYTLIAAVLEVKEDRQTFLVEPALLEELPGEIVPKLIVTGISRQNVLFLWPLRLPGPDGRTDEWSRSALEAADIAKKAWVRLAPNMSLGAYEIYLAAAELAEPQWPEADFEKLLSIAFRDNFIRDMDHPVIRRLRGQI